MAEERGKQSDLTRRIIGLFYETYNILGYGFAEKVYENALSYMLRQAGLAAEQQAALTVYFKGVNVGDFFADIIVENKVILELKAVECLVEAHSAQLLNYLRATDCEVGLLLNFGPQPQVVRKIMDNARKPHQKIQR